MDKYRLGIICAMKNEAQLLLEQMTEIQVENVQGSDYYTGYIDGTSVVLSICGIGKVAAAMCAQTMVLLFDPDYIINSGVAGALSTKLNIYDIVVSDSFVQHDMDTSPLGDPKGMISGINMTYLPSDKTIEETIYNVSVSLGKNTIKGIMASGDVFVSGRDNKLKINEEFNAVSCDMESASIAQVCYIAKKRFCAIRCISDCVNGDSGIEYAIFVEDAAKTVSNILINFIKTYFK